MKKAPSKPKILDAESSALQKHAAVHLADEKGEWVPEEQGEPEEFEEIAEESGDGEDLYASFARQASRIPRLSEEEERALGYQVRDFSDQKAAKKLVVHNMRLAIKMAHQYRRAWANLMDLVQEASAGMAIAAQKWDPDKGTRYGTYAAYWIRAQLTRFLMTNSRLIHTANTRAGRRVYFNLPQIRRRLLAQGKEPTVELVAKELDEDPTEVAQIMARLTGHETSLQTPLDEGGAITLQDALKNSDRSPEEQASTTEIKQLMNQVVKHFEETLENDRDRAIWKEHLIAEDPISLVDLAARFGVSKQRIGQLATRLKRAFRRHVIEELGPHTQLSWLFNQD